MTSRRFSTKDGVRDIHSLGRVDISRALCPLTLSWFMRLEVKLPDSRVSKLANPMPPNKDNQELQVVCSIIEAAIWYTVAEDVEMDP
jgi:hypothetical protein